MASKFNVYTSHVTIRFRLARSTSFVGEWLRLAVSKHQSFGWFRLGFRLAVSKHQSRLLQGLGRVAKLSRWDELDALGV